MSTPSLSVVDSEEGVTLDDSIGPPTPTDSSSFSPELRPRDDSAYSPVKAQGNNSQFLSFPLFDITTPATSVRNICCVGAGFVGGPTAAVIALHNPHLRVTVVDKDEQRIRRWNSKHPPIHEPGLKHILRITRDGSRECTFHSGSTRFRRGSDDERDSPFHNEGEPGAGQCQSDTTSSTGANIRVPARSPNLVFTTEVAKSISEADIVLIAVNTPTKRRGHGAGSATDMAAFETVTAFVAQHARPGIIIVEKSTVPCMTARLVQGKLALYRPGVPFEVLSNPEFLAAGTAVKDLLHADRILIGSSNTPSGHRAAAALAAVYASWIPRSRIITINVFSSELAKLVANAMLAQRISSINSIAAVCDATGADVDEVAEAIGADPRIGGKFLKAGIGFGGSCFKKDVLSLVYLAETLGLPEVARYWRAVTDMNEFARTRFTSRVISCLNNTLAGKKLTVLGYAFKKDTNDTRESPALHIVQTLLEEGPKELAVFDPLCNPAQIMDEIDSIAGPEVLQRNGGPVVVYTDVYAACRGSDAVLITTEFDEFRNLPMQVEAKMEMSIADPRPFDRDESNESDLLSLHSYLLQSQTAVATASGHIMPEAESTFGRLQPMPPCPDNCPDCLAEKAVGAAGAGASMKLTPKRRLDWRKIYYHMNRPQWVFDGRGVLDIAAMEKIGFRVESVGRQSRISY
ncbi:uncharacterized protein B0T15DRAFT_186668 [Chaetomium strumarium]|uniref:UDP-glucose 6-dehydrogenase n=1 Tax=Chaetomium strumarium TaxID=1170767 RepID=A0AAJ0M101_9PEZI|nr:hypothetical protein B0T15DRAFT_186668 [Chaetomium strumarium]